MKAIGIHLKELDERKNMASGNEDYDAAKVIKMEMHKIRSASMNPWAEQLIKEFGAARGIRIGDN